MFIIIALNVLALLLGFGIARQIVPMKPFMDLILFVHRAVGISMPSPSEARLALLVWAACLLMLLDTMFLLFAYVF